MSNSLTTQEQNSIAATGVQFTQDQVQLIKSQIMDPQATDDELALFLHQATRTGLDPLAKQIYAVFRWDKRAQRKKMTIQVAIDGYRLVAQRTGEMDGVEGPVWCGDDGVWREVWLDSEPPRAAKVTVYRKGCAHGFPAIAEWNAYVQTDKNGRPTQFWQRMGYLMLGKCAEGLALRRAFPAELSGVYTDEEMQQADQRQQLPSPQPTPQPVHKDVEVVKTTATGDARPCRICKRDISEGDETARLQNGDEIREAHWACYRESIGEPVDVPEVSPEEPVKPVTDDHEDDDLPY